MAKKILIVEDEEDIVELLTYNLSKNGFQVSSVSQGEEAVRSVRQNKPDLILLDLMLPGLDGMDVCRLLKRESSTRHIPIVMVTAKGDEADIVSGLELGADDYVTKPFSPKVLLSRIKAILRRDGQSKEAASFVGLHGIEMDLDQRRVRCDGKEINLTYSEFQALHLLLSHPGRVFTRNQMIEEVHGHNHIVVDRTVDVLLVNLRKKLGSKGELIETVRGVGYRLKD